VRSFNYGTKKRYLLGRRFSGKAKKCKFMCRYEGRLPCYAKENGDGFDSLMRNLLMSLPLHHPVPKKVLKLKVVK